MDRATCPAKCERTSDQQDGRQKAGAGRCQYFSHCHPSFWRYVVNVQSRQRFCWQTSLFPSAKQVVMANQFSAAFHVPVPDCAKVTFRNKSTCILGKRMYIIIDLTSQIIDNGVYCLWQSWGNGFYRIAAQRKLQKPSNLWKGAYRHGIQMYCMQ